MLRNAVLLCTSPPLTLGLDVLVGHLAVVSVTASSKELESDNVFLLLPLPLPLLLLLLWDLLARLKVERCTNILFCELFIHLGNF